MHTYATCVDCRQAQVVTTDALQAGCCINSSQTKAS